MSIRNWEYCTACWRADTHVMICYRPTNDPIKEFQDDRELVRFLCQLGSEGWEMVGCSPLGPSLFWTFKREKYEHPNS